MNDSERKVKMTGPEKWATWIKWIREENPRLRAQAQIRYDACEWADAELSRLREENGRLREELEKAVTG